MTEIERPRHFRVLIIGRANAGKTSILRAVCGVDEEPEVYDQEGYKVTPDVYLKEVPEARHVKEASEARHLKGEAETRDVEEVSEAHHPGDGEIATRSAFRSALRSIRTGIMCRAPDSILVSHQQDSAPSPLRRETVLASHQTKEMLNLAPSPSRREPKSILSPTSLRGEHRIDYELRFPSKPGFIFHDSRGFESGAIEELELVRGFIGQRGRQGSMKNQLHAIWYCFPADSSRLMTAAEQVFFDKIDTGSVPVIAVVTKFDALDADACSTLCGQGVLFEIAKRRAPQHANERFKKECLPLINSLSHPPRAVVCLRNMHDRKSPAAIEVAAAELIKKTEAALDSDALRILLIQAHRTNVESCMATAMENGGIKQAAQSVVGADPATIKQVQRNLVYEIFRWFPTIWVSAVSMLFKYIMFLP
ncbi:hypothetical protein BOTBODRAFT_299926 [Botryobasidium botryosum FD-172 SS1]|uniref:G domain-containing protein n=1 Tax=Botryobasidium botryosum (strain FD-172 SS1) TaxID=930990 RepID=A0A067MJT0_BOTB1|nr:hypothetical protein BOTBODRAFT_299926 [Botryobasidium botryosum FD-172 SS1]